jgi:alkylhydroperoxidase family enzyme
MSDAMKPQMRSQFDEAGIAKLTLAIAVINSLNRIAVGLRFPPK